MGYDNFHVYLFNAVTGKKIGPLEEIVVILDTGAGAYAAKWSDDSSEVTIIWRWSRHDPLLSMTYRLAKGRAIPKTKKPVNVPSEGKLAQFWQHSGDKPPEKTFGTPKQRE